VVGRREEKRERGGCEKGMVCFIFLREFFWRVFSAFEESLDGISVTWLSLAFNCWKGVEGCRRITTIKTSREFRSRRV
jgi:hypothetical protein